MVKIVSFKNSSRRRALMLSLNPFYRFERHRFKREALQAEQRVETEREGRFIYYRLNQNFLTASALKRALDFGCCKIELGE